MLEHNCVSCHREGNVKGNVRLDTKEEAFKGDDVIIAGNPEDSSLYWTTTLPTDDELFMPPIKNEEGLSINRCRKSRLDKEDEVAG